MKRRTILCEGPEDIAALRGIVQHVISDGHLWRVVPATANLGVGESRQVVLQKSEEAQLVMKAVPGAKSKLAASLKGQFGLTKETDDHIALLFDPDSDLPPIQQAECEAEIKSLAPVWKMTVLPAKGQVAQWKMERLPDLAVTVHCIPWHSQGRTLDDLDPKVQHLERILCEVLARSKPDLLPTVEQWLIGMKALPGVTPTWKSAMHLWCALVEPKLSTATFAEKVLGQEETMREVAKAVLGETTLLEDLRPLLEV